MSSLTGVALLCLAAAAASDPVGSFPGRFREAGVVTEVRRLGPGTAGRVQVELRRSGQVWTAEVGEDVVVQTNNLAEPRIDGLELVRPLMPTAGLYLVRDPARTLDAVALAQKLVPLVEQGVLNSAAPDLWLPHRAAGIRVPPDDPRLGGQWYLAHADVETAWALNSGSPDTAVAVIDDGCDLNHPDLKDHLLPGRDVVDNDDDPSYVPNESGNEHGTACAGIVSATTDNGIGIAGTCPDCRIRCVRLLPPANQLVPVSADVDAFQFVLSSGSAVASNSWGYTTSIPAPSAVATAIHTLETQGRGGLGAVVVFAAGNDARDVAANEIQAIDTVVNVGAVNNFDEAAQFSNRGESIAVVAPTGTLTLDISGSDGLDPTDYTNNFGGTSSSCPVVAGIAGLLLSARPELTAAEVRQLLKETARPAPFATPDANGHDLQYGFGIVDGRAALARALGVEAPDAGTDAGPPAHQAPTGCHCGSTSVWDASLLSLLTLLRHRRRSRPA